MRYLPRVVKFIETESRRVAAGGQREGQCRVSVLQVKTSRDWLPNAVNLLNTTELYVLLKVVQMVSFMCMCVFCHNYNLLNVWGKKRGG